MVSIFIIIIHCVVKAVSASVTLEPSSPGDFGLDDSALSFGWAN